MKSQQVTLTTDRHRAALAVVDLPGRDDAGVLARLWRGATAERVS